MNGKNILIGVTGGIAAYKTPNLVSMLVKQGYNVDVILTENAMNFITPNTFTHKSHGMDALMSINAITIDLDYKKIPEYKNSQEFIRLNKILRDTDLVVWDDIASSTLTNADHVNLSSIIDPRILKGKSNIFTGNLLSEELREAVGNRLHNRIWDSSEVIKFIGRGRRC